MLTLRLKDMKNGETKSSKEVKITAYDSNHGRFYFTDIASYFLNTNLAITEVIHFKGPISKLFNQGL